MKKITLTIKEFYLFKEIAEFLYDFSISKESVIIKADAHQLELIGY
jgi:hypothetical protein